MTVQSFLLLSSTKSDVESFARPVIYDAMNLNSGCGQTEIYLMFKNQC